jgi:hypothetical protein
MSAAAALTATAGALFLLSGSPSPAERADCVCLLDGATSAVVGAVRIFEARRPGTSGSVAAAQRALVAASDARDALESSSPSEACAPSWAEELIYLNHLIPGFRAWLDARSRDPAAEYDIASIIRRARAHRERGRARLR